MRVLVTGGTGRVGKAVTARLVEHGWDVRVIGIERDVQIQGAEYVTCDILNYDHLREQVRGCQCIVHLAAIPNPLRALGKDIFQVNTTGTFHVFEAAAAEGIRRVAQASSINALGCAWNLVDVSPGYFPLDEEHPTLTSDPYSFSKNVVEEIGAYYWRREGISSVALRLPAVFPADHAHSEPVRQQRERIHRLLDELGAQSAAEREARLAEARERALELRRQRFLEFPAPPTHMQVEDLLAKVYTIDRFNYWAYVDERDSAQAMEKGLTAEFEGSHALFVTAADNWFGYDSATLVRLFFPDVTLWKYPVQGSETLISIAKARALIGFQPEYSLQLLNRR